MLELHLFTAPELSDKCLLCLLLKTSSCLKNFSNFSEAAGKMNLIVQVHLSYPLSQSCHNIAILGFVYGRVPIVLNKSITRSMNNGLNKTSFTISSIDVTEWPYCETFLHIDDSSLAVE